METLNKLEQQNQEISELCKVLQVLLTDNSVCDTRIARELFRRFTDKVKEHLSLEDNTLYAKMLGHGDKHINALTKRFLSNSLELQRIFLDYERLWCREGVEVTGNDAFIRETHGIFAMIRERIKAERDEFFPAANTALA
ncbi:MAG: hemerythrin domain-containing protein [Gammaproteobacteria bacterium]|nr:hemerythrin domain-containing protein [Gammaproteobacteria bacterium]